VPASSSAPASLMLMGEHAVLHGKKALACAVDKRITVHARHIDSDRVVIKSSLGTYTSSIHDIQPDPRFTFVLASVEGYPQGLELEIESEFSHQVGLGSSAAVTVATLAAIHGPALERMQLFEKSLQVIRRVQKRGSGADVAASVFGQIVLYRMQPQSIESIKCDLPLTLIYSGSKMPTAEVIARIEVQRAEKPALFDALFNCMDSLVEEAKEAITTQNLPSLGQLFNMHHGLQEALGTCNKPLAEIVHLLRLQSAIYGAKISGSGLGDCALGLGSCTLDSPYQQIPIAIAKNGVQFL
jgi:mevalonate kinase